MSILMMVMTVMVVLIRGREIDTKRRWQRTCSVHLVTPAFDDL